MTGLIRFDPAWKVLLFLAPGAALAGFAIHNTMSEEGSKAAITALALAGVFALLTSVLAQPASVSFWASMPILPRDVFAGRAVAAIALIWITVAALECSIRSRAVVDLAAAATAGAIAMHGHQVRRRRYGLILPLPMMLLMGCFPLLDSRYSALLELLLAAAGILLFAWNWATIPVSIPVEPRLAARESTKGQVAAPHMASPRAMWRSLYSWRSLVSLPALFFQTMTVGTLGLVFAGTWWVTARPAVAWLFALPLSRRKILAIMLLPVLLAAVAGTLVHWHLPWQTFQIEVAYTDAPECRLRGTGVPLRAWRVASGGKAALARAPWGEAFLPGVRRIMGVEVYNPYSIGCVSSARFIDWQAERAKAVKESTPPWRAQFADAVFAIYVTLTILGLTLLNDWRPMRRLSKRRRLAVVGATFAMVFLLALLPYIGIVAQTQARGGRSLAPPTAGTLLQWLIWILPGAKLALILLPLPLFYLAVDKFFREAEFSSAGPNDRWSRR